MKIHRQVVLSPELLYGEHFEAYGVGDAELYAGRVQQAGDLVSFKFHDIVTVLVGYQQEIAGGVDHKIAGSGAKGGLEAFEGKPAIGGIDGIDGDAVGISPVRYIQEAAIGRIVDIGAAFSAAEAGGMRADVLQGGKPAVLAAEYCYGATHFFHQAGIGKPGVKDDVPGAGTGQCFDKSGTGRC